MSVSQALVASVLPRLASLSVQNELARGETLVRLLEVVVSKIGGAGHARRDASVLLSTAGSVLIAFDASASPRAPLLPARLSAAVPPSPRCRWSMRSVSFHPVPTGSPPRRLGVGRRRGGASSVPKLLRPQKEMTAPRRRLAAVDLSMSPSRDCGRALACDAAVRSGQGRSGQAVAHRFSHQGGQRRRAASLRIGPATRPRRARRPRRRRLSHRA